MGKNDKSKWMDLTLGIIHSIIVSIIFYFIYYDLEYFFDRDYGIAALIVLIISALISLVTAMRLFINYEKK